MARGISLSFATITCDRCSATRLMTKACTECGLKPRRHETQPDLERRRKVLAAFRAAEVEPPLVTDSLEEAVSKVSPLIADILRALGNVGRESRSARGITDAFARLDAQAEHWTRRHPRPLTNRARVFGRSLTLLREGLGTFAETLGSDTLLAAQELQGRGQALIDAAAEEIDRLQEIAEAQSLLSGPAAYSQIGESARAVAGGEEALATLDERLREMAGSGSNRSQTGIGLNLHLLRHLMLVLFDLNQAVEVADAAEARMGDLTAVCRASSWQARHGVVTAQFSTAAFNLSAIEGDNHLEAAGAVLQMVMQCRDGVIRHCLATMLASTITDYDRLSAKGAGNLIKQAARECSELRLDENLSEVIRHAAAHFDYDVSDTHFVTHTRSGDEQLLTLDEFLDAALGYFQTAVSLLMALIRTSARQGIALELSRHTPERDIFGTIAMLLGLVGFTNVSVTKEGTELRIAAGGDAMQLATAVAGIAAVAPSYLTHVKGVISSHEGREHVWESPLETFRDYAERPASADEIDELIALVRVTARVRINDEPIWDGDKWAGMAMFVFNETEGLPLRDRVVRFKEIRDHTIANGFVEIASVLTRILEAMRQGRGAEALPPSPFTRPTSIF